MDNLVKDSVIELLELANLDSPFVPNLVRQHKRRVVSSLLADDKITQEEAVHFNG